jgi:hypothetical protein
MPFRLIDFLESLVFHKIYIIILALKNHMDDVLDTLKNYSKGYGLDVSRKPFLKVKCKYHFKVPDNFYSLKEVAVENADFILCDGIIQETKYYPIMIKEIFYALNVNGYFIVQYVPKRLSLEALEKEMFFLMKDSVDVKETLIDEQVCTIIFQKKKPNPSKPAGINNWSFGILTRGTTDDLVDEMIDTIIMQKIPNYEIIVIGKYNGRYRKDVIYLEFTQKDDKGWITKKKNLICEKAKHENILVMHDRIKLNKGWFEGMKKYGNNFEILSIKNLFNGKRAHDWISQKYPLEDRRSLWFLGGYLEYSDWDKWIFIDGGIVILKKYVWEKVHWDESRYWFEAEDLKMSNDQTRYGFLIRFNPYSSCTSVRFKHKSSKLIVKQNPRKYGRLKGPFYIIIAKYVRGYSLGVYRIMVSWFKKTK